MFTNENELERRAITKQRFADRWDVTERYIEILIKDNVLPVVKLGKRCVRVPVVEGDAALMRYMQNARGMEATK